jgi:hypothetical protein
MRLCPIPEYAKKARVGQERKISAVVTPIGSWGGTSFAESTSKASQKLESDKIVNHPERSFEEVERVVNGWPYA